MLSEKAMAPHSSTLAWTIPRMEEPGRLQSMGSLRVGHDRATSLSLFTFVHWRRKWQPTPVFLPGESQGQGSLVGCHVWGHTESDTTEAKQQQLYALQIYQLKKKKHYGTYILVQWINKVVYTAGWWLVLLGKKAAKKVDMCLLAEGSLHDYLERSQKA